MDIDLIRGILTAVIFMAFIGIWAWAWSSRRKSDFDASAALPLEDDDNINDSIINNSRENI
jgi:cytochrome c oxidase cbb3-type subunit 4